MTAYFSLFISWFRTIAKELWLAVCAGKVCYAKYRRIYLILLVISLRDGASHHAGVAIFTSIHFDCGLLVNHNRSSRIFGSYEWGTWPIFIEIAITKSSKNDEEHYKQHLDTISRSSESRVQSCVWRHWIRGIRQNLRILWRHTQLWTRFLGDWLIVSRCFWRFFVIFWTLSDGYLDKSWSSTPWANKKGTDYPPLGLFFYRFYKIK